MEKILQHLKLKGQQLDADIALALRLPLELVRSHLDSLSMRGEVMVCHVTRFEGKRKTEGWSCRLAGTIPVAAPGRKPGRPQAASS